MIDIQIKLNGILDLAVRLLIGDRTWGTYERAFARSLVDITVDAPPSGPLSNMYVQGTCRHLVQTKRNGLHSLMKNDTSNIVAQLIRAQPFLRPLTVTTETH